MRLHSRRDKLQFSALLLPGVLAFALFTIYPILKLFVMSFLHWNLGSMFDKSFAGLENYKAVLSDKTFLIAFENTLIYTLVTVLRTNDPWFACCSSDPFHPAFPGDFPCHLLYPGHYILGDCISRLPLHLQHGRNAELFIDKCAASDGKNIAWLNTRWGGMTVVMLLGIWKGVGWNLVVFLAALQSVPNELYEAAEVDGCGSVSKFFPLPFPASSPPSCLLWLC